MKNPKFFAWRCQGKIWLIALIFLTVQFQSIAQPSDAYIQNIMNLGHIPGATAVIIKDGHWMYSKSWGKADIPNNTAMKLSNIFMMASISKTIIATAVMQCWEKGMFHLDDNIQSHLPFLVQNPNQPNDTITFRMLLTHTSAIQDNYDVLDALYVDGDSPISLDTFLRNYFVPGGTYYNATDNFYTYHSGSTYNYSNIGATLAAYLVQRMVGDDFSHYCDTAIFEKICMKNTSFKLAGIADTTMIARPYHWYNGSYIDVGLYGYPDYPDGQLRTNITSLARFMTMYMQYGIFNGTRILDSSTVAMMMQQQTPADPTQGLIFYKAPSSNGDYIWGHEGGDIGVSTAMYFNYPSKTGVIVLTNGTKQSNYNMDRIVDTLYKYGKTLTPTAADSFPSCNSVAAVETIAATVSEPMLYPNPAKTIMNISFKTEMQTDVAMFITDIAGKKIKDVINGKIMAGNNHLSVDVNDMPDGFYFLSILSANNRSTIKFSVIK